MAQKSGKSSHEMALYFIGVLAWLIPGAGHWLLGMRHRAVIIFVAICSTFLIGLLLGSIEVIDPQNAIAWFCAQVLCGLPTIIVTRIQDSAVSVQSISEFGRGVDIGQVYAGIAGLLNLICVLDALLRSQTTIQADKISSPQK